MEQTEEAIAAREDSLANKWVGFRNNAQLQICERGGRKKMGRCRDKVKDVLDASMRDRYVHCIRSGQSVASLHEAGKGEQLPDYAEWLDEESRITRGWYILLCDPTLPEAEDLEEVEHLLAVDQLDLDDEDDFEMDGEDDQPALDDTEQPEPDVWDLDEESSSRKRDRRSRREDRVDGPSEEGRSPSLLDDLDLDELDEYDTLDD